MNRRGLIGGLPLAAAPGVALAQTRAPNPQPAPARPAARPSRTMGPIAPEGAIADGASHPLSERFANLAAAQAAFPHAGALTDEIDWCALQGAIDRAIAQGGGAVQVPNGGRGYVLNRGLVVNPNMVTLRGDGSLLDFRTLPAGKQAIWFKADGAPSYGHDKHVFEGFDILGPGRDRDTIGVFFQTDTPGLSSRTQLRDCVVRNFRFALEIGHRAYLISFAHCSFFECHYVFRAPAGLDDSGESITFNQCVLFNSYCLIANMAGCGLRFIGCALDYADRVVWDNNGHIDFVSCHIEFAPPSEVPFHNGVGRIDFHGGFIQINGNAEPRVAGLFASNIETATYHMFGLRGWNWGTTTGRLAEGPGKIYWHQGTAIDAPPEGYGKR